MVKNYIAEARLAPAKLKKLIGGGAITINPSDIANSANNFVKLQFGKLKDLNRYKRNLTSNKGFRIKPSMITDMVDGVSGGSIWTKGLMELKKVGDKMGKPFEKTTKVNPFTLGYKLGHDVIAPALMKAGIGPKKGGKLPKVKIDRKTKKTFEAIGKAFGKEAKRAIKNNKDELKNIGRAVVESGINAANGEASGKQFGRNLLKAGKEISHVVGKEELTKAGLFGAENPYQYGQYKPKAVEVPVIEGSGLDAGLGGNRLVNNPRVNAQSRMAHARSFRKKGGSFRPL